jgi:hypothetical protein
LFRFTSQKTLELTGCGFSISFGCITVLDTFL